MIESFIVDNDGCILIITCGMCGRLLCLLFFNIKKPKEIILIIGQLMLKFFNLKDLILIFIFLFLFSSEFFF